MRGINTERMILERLEKAVHSGNITAVVPEDLEIEAHSTLWDETDPTELTALKLIPNVQATSIVHEYTRVNSYGYRRNSGFFNERALPPETNFGSTRVTNNIKLIGEVGPTFLLAALEKTQKALGTMGAQNIERVAIRRNVLWKKNLDLYFADTRATRDGVSSARFKGLAQLIEEGTDGTSGTSSFGSHMIDMEGQPLTLDSVRDKVGKGIVNFGRFSSLIMDPLARADLEASFDAAHRINVPNPLAPYLVGQSIGGIQTQGGVTYFETDVGLSSIYSRPQYTTDLIDGAPTGTPTVVVTAQADNSTTDTVDSKWDADSAGNIYWVVTEMVDEKEGLGTRYPAGSGYTAVAAGQEAAMVLTPSSAEVQSFKVYRGAEDENQVLATDAWFIFEVAAAAGGAAVTAFDNNLFRPETTWAFGLNIISSSERALHTYKGDGTLTAYEHARARSTDFLRNADTPRNTVAVASLGPTMGILALASVLAEVDRPLVYSACCPEVRNPLQNFVFKNIGRSA